MLGNWDWIGWEKVVGVLEKFEKKLSIIEKDNSNLRYKRF
jgi:hypothetical protein